MLILVVKSLLTGWAGYQLSLLLIDSFGRTGWGKGLQDQMIWVNLGVTWMENTLRSQVLVTKIISLHHQIIWSELFYFRCRLLILSSLRIEVGCVHALDWRLCILTHLLEQEAFLGGRYGRLLVKGHCIDVAIKVLRWLRLALSIGRIELRAGWGAELMIARKYRWVVCSFHRIWRQNLHRAGTHLSRIHCKILVLDCELPLVLLLGLIKLSLSYHLCVCYGVATLLLQFLMVLVCPELLLLLHLLHC